MPNKTEKVDPLHSGILLLAGNSVCGSSSLQPYLHKSYYSAKLTIIKKLAHHDHSTPQSDRNIDRVNAEFIAEWKFKSEMLMELLYAEESFQIFKRNDDVFIVMDK